MRFRRHCALSLLFTFSLTSGSCARTECITRHPDTQSLDPKALADIAKEKAEQIREGTYLPEKPDAGLLDQFANIMSIWQACKDPPR
jgi:hypothetical protein